jgi:primosomal protein N' (replication factor Y)
MIRAVRVAVESPLMQLDREFDFLVPESLQSSVEFGQRVSFRFGRSKTSQTGFVTQLLESSKFATSPIDGLVGTHPVLTQQILTFARRVADRQCVALGEILSAAVPDHMPRIQVERPPARLPKEPPSATREVLLTGKQVAIRETFYPQWMPTFLTKSKVMFDEGFSSILLVPESSDANWLIHCANAMGIEVLNWEAGAKSEKFRKFNQAFEQLAIVIGTRSAIYVPVANLGLIAQADDADDSYQDVGSPHTNLRDLVLLRADVSGASVLFAAPYRSVELQRLVEIGYLSEAEAQVALPRISYSSSSVRVDDISLKLAKEALSKGTLLLLLPRKGTSTSAFCQGCGERIKCSCGGFVWEPTDQTFSCRICARVVTSCAACKGTSFRRGRSGSARTTAEVGKMFPGSVIFEAAGSKKPELSGKRNQILIATPGSAPRLAGGYSGLIVLDSDVWLSAQALRAEQRALRDWCEAFELLSPDARIHFSGLSEELGRPIALGQHREMAKQAFLEAKKLNLPPAIRFTKVTGSREQVSKAVSLLEQSDAEVVRNSGTEVLFRFSYKDGPRIAKELRAVATTARALRRGDKNIRGLSVVMDDGSL